MAKAASLPREEKMPINRREFLNFAWFASLGFLTVDLAGMTYLFAMPRFEEGEFGGIFTFGPVSDLPSKGSAPVNYPKVKIWISNTDAGLLALYKVCTHLGCLYGWKDAENKFVCPCHGSQFQANGTYIQGPAPRSLDRFVVQLVDSTSGAVIAQSDDGAPLPVPDNQDTLVQVDTGKRIRGQQHD